MRAWRAGLLTAVLVPGVARPAPRVEDWDLAELLGTVVAASDREQRAVASPAAVTVLTRDDLAGALSIPDALRRVPGLDVVEVGPGNAIVAARGMGGLEGNDLLVLLDGIPINRAIDGSVRWASLPVSIDQIDRIEVVRGPVSPIYGANAYAGVVKLIADTEGATSRAEIEIGPVGRGIRRASYATLRHRRDGLALRLDASSLDVGRPSGGPAPIGTLAAAFQASWAPDDTWRVRLRVARSRAVIDGATALIPTPNRYVEPTFLNALSVERRGRGVLRSIRFDGRHHLRMLRDIAVPTGPSLSGSVESVGQVGAVAHLALPTETDVRVEAGGGVESATAPYLTAPTRWQAVWRGRLAVEQGIGTWRVSGAGRVDHSPLVALGPSWRLAAVGPVTPGTHARVAVASAFRSPSWVEAYGDFRAEGDGMGGPMGGGMGGPMGDGAGGSMGESSAYLLGNPDLKPQRITSVEVGGHLMGGRDLVIQPTVYVASVDHLIVLDTETHTFRDVHTARFGGLVGVEVEGTWSASDAAVLRASAARVWVAEDLDVRDALAAPGHVARFTGSVSLTGHVGRLSYGVHVTGASRRRYEAWTGMPSIYLSSGIPPRVLVGGTVAVRVDRALGLDLRLTGRTMAPKGSQSPLPGGMPQGTFLLAAVSVETP